MKNQTTIRATLLFVFTPDLSKVLLIEKTKPDFHKGLLNGLGGKNFAGESDTNCASRELKEESNAKTMEDETVKWYSSQPLPKNCIPNLTWLIPMAEDALQGAKWQPVVVHYKN